MCPLCTRFMDARGTVLNPDSIKSLGVASYYWVWDCFLIMVRDPSVSHVIESCFDFDRTLFKVTTPHFLSLFNRFCFTFSLSLYLSDLLLVPWFVGTVCLSLVASLSKTRPSPFLYLLYRASLLILWVGIWVCHGA